MPDVTADMTVTLDGYGSGVGQSAEHPFGDMDPEKLHSWMFDHAEENAAERAAIVTAGAYIMGRNMFGPVRGPWDEDWRGWWGDEPPYHAPVFVLTHYAHEPIELNGGTMFHFVTDGFAAALEQARAAAGDREIAVAGGASTVRQALAAGAIDELTLDVAPVLLGAGERLFDGVDDPGLEIVDVVHSPHATHIHYRIVGPQGA